MNKQRKLRNFIIDKNLQYKLAIMVSGTTFALAAINCAFFYISMQNKLAITSDIAEIQKSLLETAVIAGSTSLVFVILSIFMTIYFTHKIAGPHYAITRFFNQIIEHGEVEKIRLRKGDELTELAEALNQLVEKEHFMAASEQEA